MYIVLDYYPVDFMRWDIVEIISLDKEWETNWLKYKNIINYQNCKDSLEFIWEGKIITILIYFFIIV